MSGLGLPPEVERIAHLLSRGLDDRAVARAEGIDVRTVRRRVASLLQELDSRTRFQAGYRFAARAGALGETPDAG